MLISVCLLLFVFGSCQLILTSSNHAIENAALHRSESLVHILTDLQRSGTQRLPHWRKNVVYTMDEQLYRLQQVSRKRAVRLLLVGTSNSHYQSEIAIFSRYFHQSAQIFIVNPDSTHFEEVQRQTRSGHYPPNVHIFGVPPSNSDSQVGDVNFAQHSVLATLGIFQESDYNNQTKLFDFFLLTDDTVAEQSASRRALSLRLYLQFLLLMKPAATILVMHTSLRTSDIPDLGLLHSPRAHIKTPPVVEGPAYRRSPSDMRTLIEYFHYYADLLNYFFQQNPAVLNESEGFNFVRTRNLLFEDGLTVVQLTKRPRSNFYGRVVVGTQAQVFPKSIELGIDWGVYYNLDGIDY